MTPQKHTQIADGVFVEARPEPSGDLFDMMANIGREMSSMRVVEQRRALERHNIAHPIKCREDD